MKDTLILNSCIINENFLWLLVSIFLSTIGDLVKSLHENHFSKTLLLWAYWIYCTSEIKFWFDSFIIFLKFFLCDCDVVDFLNLNLELCLSQKEFFKSDISFDRFCFYLVNDTRNVYVKVINRCLFKIDLIFFFLHFWLLKIEVWHIKCWNTCLLDGDIIFQSQHLLMWPNLDNWWIIVF